MPVPASDKKSVASDGGQRADDREDFVSAGPRFSSVQYRIGKKVREDTS